MATSYTIKCTPTPSADSHLIGNVAKRSIKYEDFSWAHYAPQNVEIARVSPARSHRIAGDRAKDFGRARRNRTAGGIEMCAAMQNSVRRYNV